MRDPEPMAWSVASLKLRFSTWIRICSEPPDPDSNPAPADLQSGHETLYDFYCMLCHEDDRHVEATCYCATCDEYMCATCGNYHRKSRLSRHHALTDAASMPRDRPLVDRVDKTITSMCDEHPTELLRYSTEVNSKV